jgi:hypothetical protein
LEAKTEIVQQQVYVEAVPDKTHAQPENRRRFNPIVLGVLLSALAVIPFYFFGRPQYGQKSWTTLQMPITHDMHLHMEQMKSFYNGLAAGKLYPRWEEDTNRGFGAPTMSYYPPGVYYLTSAFYAIFKNWILALLFTHLSMMIASALAFFLYVRQYLSHRASLFAMAAYIFLPYHLIDQYHRGAMAELLGFVWMPLMLYFGERMFRSKDPEEAVAKKPPSANVWLNLAGLALSYGAFLWSHPPTAYQFSLAFGLYMLVLAALRRDVKGLILLGGAVLLGVLLSAAYLYPASAEQDLIRHEYITDTWPYHSTYIFYHHLPYTSSAGGFLRMLDVAWTFSALMIALSGCFFYLYLRRQASAKLRERLILWCVLGGFAAFMMLEYSAVIGRHIPKIEIGVFTWRMLAISTLVTALFAGYCAHLAADKNQFEAATRSKFRVLSWLILGGGIIFSIIAVARPMVLAPHFIPSQEHVNYATIVHDGPEDPLEMPHLERVMLVKGKGEVAVEKWQPQSRLIRAVLTDSDTLFIRTFNFPGWTATVNGQRVEIKTGEVLKEMNLELPAGESLIKLEYLNTPVRARGELASKLAASIILLLLAIGWIKRRMASKRDAMS